MHLPRVPPSAPRFGNRLTRALGRAVLRAAGWRIEGQIPDLPRCVVILAPHTSNLDLPLGLAAMFAVGVRVNWLGKHTIFRGPFGWFLRGLGGIPLDRGHAAGVVAQAAGAMRAAPRMFLGLAPEGTRARVPAWKTGFHRIACAARVPIVPAALDYSRRVVWIWPPFTPTGDAASDVAAIQRRYQASMGRHPDRYGQ